MKIADKVVVVTGGASGIGRALCLRFAAEGARSVWVVDRAADGAHAVAGSLTNVGTAVACDVGDRVQMAALVARVEAEQGRVDLFCSNAGVGTAGSEAASDEDWATSWSVNVM